MLDKIKLTPVTAILLTVALFTIYFVSTKHKNISQIFSHQIIYQNEPAHEFRWSSPAKQVPNAQPVEGSIVLSYYGTLLWQCNRDNGQIHYTYTDTHEQNLWNWIDPESNSKSKYCTQDDWTSLQKALEKLKSDFKDRFWHFEEAINEWIRVLSK